MNAQVGVPAGGRGDLLGGQARAGLRRGVLEHDRGVRHGVEDRLDVLADLRRHGVEEVRRQQADQIGAVRHEPPGAPYRQQRRVVLHREDGRHVGAVPCTVEQDAAQQGSFVLVELVELRGEAGKHHAGHAGAEDMAQEPVEPRRIDVAVLVERHFQYGRDAADEGDRIRGVPCFSHRA
jgi:hypothetical protein